MPNDIKFMLYIIFGSLIEQCHDKYSGVHASTFCNIYVRILVSLLFIFIWTQLTKIIQRFISAAKYSNEYYSFDTLVYYLDSTYMFLKFLIFLNA